jgi:hypothetical protein
MRAFGQIVHVEDMRCNGARYRIAVFRVRGGLQGKWSCEACDVGETQKRSYPNLDDCLAAIKDAINRHHAANHP